MSESFELQNFSKEGCVSTREHCSRIPSAENIYNLAKFFGVSADYLLGLED